MSQKIGKRQQKLRYGESYGIDFTRDENGKIKRLKNGRRYGTNYQHHTLNAWSGLDNRLYPYCTTNNYRVRKSKQRLLDRIDNCWTFGQVHPRTYTQEEYAKHRSNLVRNNVTVNPKVN